MRAVVYERFGEWPSVRDVAEPRCPDGGALIAVAASGVCRSDWHGWQGHDADIVLPHTPGHEFAGMVVDVGAGVDRAWLGRSVTAPFVCGCGHCDCCRAGDAQVCPNQTQPGFTHSGSFADLVAVHAADTNLVEVPDGLDPVVAAGLGCRFATAYRAVVAHGRPRPDDWVAVHGCGGVGLSAVMIAAARGARVIAVDPSPAARDLAAQLGATHTLEPPAADAVRELTGGGARVSLDAFGGASTLADSIAGLRRRGRHVQVGLLAGTPPAVDMATVLRLELELYGSHGMAARDYPAMLAEITTGRLDPARLVGRQITLDEVPDALVAMGTAPTYAGTTVAVLA